MKPFHFLLWLGVLGLLASGCRAAPGEAAPAATLPASMKGYELYSWEQDGEWRFTLIVGTNRIKTLEEIQSAEDAQSADGWVKRTVSGVEALKELLAELPPGEFITWAGAGIPGEPGGGLALPPEEMVQAVEEQARALGLELSVTR